MEEQNQWATMDDGVLVCSGYWTIHNLMSIRQSLAALKHAFPEVSGICFSNVASLDSAGAIVFVELQRHLAKQAGPIKVSGVKSSYQDILQLVDGESLQAVRAEEGSDKGGSVILPQLGCLVISRLNNMRMFFAFLGEFVILFLRCLRSPGRFYFSSFVSILFETACRAMPIIALMSFLIGVVLAYQLGVQLQMYGANIYIAKFSGVGVFREFGPLITAIIMAGRTSTAFASLIGSMKVNQEVDAIATMGVSPQIMLVFPRVLALLIALPLLAVWANLFCLLGSMVIGKLQLQVSYPIFIDQLRRSVGVRHYILGMMKTPFFAMAIAFVGCYQGMMTEMNAESVGRQTTRAAVHAIFLVIIVDAFFSVLFSLAGL